MKTLHKLVHKGDGIEKVITTRLAKAETFLDRLLGLIPISEWNEFDALFIPECRSIHMWFMRMSIDVVFVDRSGKITSTHSSVKAWKLLPLNDFSSKDVYELPQGSVARLALRKGDELCIV
jgi:uncharacterized membrane protein (UPF0127 family)